MAPDNLREPISTYGQAKRWLFTHSNIEEWLFDAEAYLPLEALAICDIFWIKQEKLVRDMRKSWNEALSPGTSAPYRRKHFAGWR